MTTFYRGCAASEESVCGCRAVISPEESPHVCKVFIVFGKEVDEFVVAEERVHIVCLRQDVAAPAVQHRELEEGGEILCLVLKE
ncbi:MAG: hypothetical protein ABSF98_06170 [Bryobacteraceae bacterium]